MSVQNTYVVAEENDDDHNIVIVSSTWLTPKKTDAFWPRFKHNSQYNKSLIKHDTPDYQTWQLITLKRKFYETEDLMTARLKAKQAESMSDVNDYDEVGKKRTKKPIRLIDSDISSSELEEDALDLFRIDNVAGSCAKKKNKLNEISKKDQNSEGIPCYNQFQSNQTLEKEVSLNLNPIDGQSTSADHRSRKGSTETDITKTPKSTGTVKKYFKLPAETSIEDDIKVWLKHAPQRLKTSSMKKLNSSSNKDN